MMHFNCKPISVSHNISYGALDHWSIRALEQWSIEPLHHWSIGALGIDVRIYGLIQKTSKMIRFVITGIYKE